MPKLLTINCVFFEEGCEAAERISISTQSNQYAIVEIAFVAC